MIKFIFKNLLIDNKDFKINFEFKIQNQPNGIAEAFIIGEDFIQNDDVCLILAIIYFLIQNSNKTQKFLLKK